MPFGERCDRCQSADKLCFAALLEEGRQCFACRRGKVKGACSLTERHRGEHALAQQGLSLSLTRC